jgi:hypothetical protein
LITTSPPHKIIRFSAFKEDCVIGSRLRRLLWWCCCCICCSGILASPASAQTVAAPDPGPVPKYVAEPIGLLSSALGTFHRPISSTNPEAQKFFDQGFQMMYAFARLDAVRSFRESWKRDPNCAICYWGEAWAWGSYLNGPMPAEQSPFAYYALHKAISLKNVQATPIEKDFIDALTPRYVEKFDAKTRRTQDEAYAESMRQLSEKYPNDLDAATLYGDALFLLEPRRGRRDVNAPNIKRLHGVLEGVLAKDNQHPGACHLYVHATESTVRPQLAESCAEFLGRSIPGASHIQHMPSHTGTRSAGGRIRCARTSRPGTPTSRPTSAKASRSTPITTCTCCSTRRRWTARGRSRCRPARTTPSAPATRCTRC